MKKIDFDVCICRTLKLGLAKYAVDANLLRLESTNPKLKSQTTGFFPFQRRKKFEIFFLKNVRIFLNNKFWEKNFFKNVRIFLRILFFFANFFFKSAQIHMNDVESVESKEKTSFRFLQFLFFELWSFLFIFVPNFWWIFQDDSKHIKIWSKLRGGGVWILLVEKNPRDDHISKTKNLKIYLTTFEKNKNCPWKYPVG